MTTLFDGMAGVMADTFGAPVLYAPKSGDPQVVQATLREGPVEVAGPDGQRVLLMEPTLHVSRTVLPDIGRGDRVAAVAAPDTTYTVVNRLPNGSPAADALIVCELEKEVV